mgnify:CR=1 FL=1
MVKSWNDRLNTPGIKPSPRTVGDVVKGQSMLVPTARQERNSLPRSASAKG